MGSVVALRQEHIIIGDDYWVDVTTGDWEADCAAGRERADLYLAHLNRREEVHPFFTQSMRSLVAKGKFSGVETGFFQRLLELSLSGLPTLPDASK